MDHQASSQASSDVSTSRPRHAFPVSIHVCALSGSRLMSLLPRVKLKPMELSYGVEAVFRDHLPRLQHGNDGLIFTGAEAPYTVGTDQRMYAALAFKANIPLRATLSRRIKWKPPSENSIDFKLELRFPPDQRNPDRADMAVKPIFLLLENHGKKGHVFFDVMEVEDEEWEA